MYLQDFVETQPEKQAMSGEDIKFLQLMEDGITREENNHYSLPLPFRNPNVSLPNNREQAVSRAVSLKKRMKKDPKFFDQLLEFYCVINNETVPLWFGNFFQDRFYTLLRRIGSVCRSTYFRDGVACTAGNFIKDDTADTLCS